MLLFLFLAFTICLTQYLFGGNGILINTYTEYNGILETNCTSYDDCYDILCEPLMPNDYLTILKPNTWSGNCSDLKGDNRLLEAQLRIINGFVKWYTTHTISQLSMLLCDNYNATKIIFYLLSC